MTPKKILCAFLAIVMLVIVFTGCDISIIVDDNNDLGAERTITFVSLNDVHGSVLQTASGKEGLSNTAYGVYTLSKYFKDGNNQTSEKDDIVLFANGDMFQGTEIGSKTHGLAVVAAMNEMGFVGMGLGNHEFDWGLDEVLRYWDGDPSNGEANFPLVTSNTTKKSAGKLVSDLSATDNVVTTLTCEREGVKIGLIACVGPCENSILASAVEDYRFEDVTSSVKKAALELKKQGCELISVNIHYGSSSGINSYGVNNNIARLKDEKGNYLVDLIFNGHTHNRQKGVIQRDGGTSVPVVQAGANNEALGYITITYNKDTKQTSVKAYDYKAITTFGTNYDKNVQAVIDDYNAQTVGKGYYAISGVTISYKSELFDYLSAVMLGAMGTDYSLANDGGVRGTGDIKKGEEIGSENTYEIVPFDNVMYYVKIKGSALYRVYEESYDYLYFGKRSGVPEWDKLKNDNNFYTLGVIDYVYTGKYFLNCIRQGDIAEEKGTALVFRELINIDMNLWGEAGEEWVHNKGAKIQKQNY